MPRSKAKRAKVQLGDSWVVEGDDEHSSVDDLSRSEGDGRSDHKFEHRENVSQGGLDPVRSRPTTNRTRDTSTEPQLIMPSWNGDSLDGSWQVTTRSAAVGAKSAARRSKVRVSSQTSSSSTAASPHRLSPKVKIDGGRSEAADAHTKLLGVLASVFNWLVDVIGMGFNRSKWGLSYLLAVLIPLATLWLSVNFLTSTISLQLASALAPVCRIPGVSMLVPACAPMATKSHEASTRSPVEFEQLMTVQSKFEEVLEHSAGSVSLPLDMKRGEASIRDLRQRVRYSSLHARNELDLEFEGFIETARTASLDLQRFNSHVGRAVDSVLATTRWTTRVLDGIAIQDQSRGLLGSAGGGLLSLFIPVRYSEDILLDQYIQHSRIVEEEIHKLIAEAQAVLRVLNNLEDRLDVIHGIATRENRLARENKEEILSYLWTMVGGNRAKLSQVDRQLSLLEQVGVYRKTAYAHVSGTILRLQEMGAQLEDLRERVAAPELLRDRVAIPLSVHIDNIQRGVDRLEAGRQHAKEMEESRMRQSLQPESNERLIDG